MSQSLAFIIKFSQANTPEIQYILERDIYVTINKHFTEKEQKGFVMDDENSTMIAFIEASDKHKLDAIVKAAIEVQPNIVSLYEDVTEKFLYKNDFSCYQIESELINKFIKSRIHVDDVFDKIKTIGADKLTKIDKNILEEW